MKQDQMQKHPQPQPQATTQQHKQNKMLRKCIKNLLHRLLHQFRSQSYDSNGIMNQYFMELKQLEQQKMQTKQKKQMEQMREHTIQEQFHDAEEEDIVRESAMVSESLNKCTINYYSQRQCTQLIQLWPEVSVFVWEIARSPKWYVEMLKNEQIYAQQTECIDMHTFTTKIYKKVMLEASKMTSFSKRFQKICADQIYFFLQEVSLQICSCFKSGQKIVVNELNYITSIVQKSQIVTFYLLYKIFKDTALICRHRIITQLEEGIFRNIQADVVQSFAHYIIEKYQVLDMKMELKKSDKEQQPVEKVPLAQKIMNANNVRWREAIREDGEIGILVQLQDEKDQNKSINYMIMFDENDEATIVNSNSISRQWKVCKKAQQNYDFMQLVKSKKSLAQKMRNSSTKGPLQMTLLENVGVLGGSMGKCLAQIDTYDNVGQFMVSLSKRTIIGGSFNYLLMSVPLLGYVFVTGGFSYTFYYIFTNQYANGDKKFRQLRNITLGSATSIGSGLIGATIGQTLIPVPMLGAFIGGLVGGFLGQFGARMIGTAMETARFKQVIEEMKNTIQPKGFWQVTDRTLNILQIKKQKFYDTIPQKLENKLNCNKIWLTLIFFTILCFHESRERIKAMQKIMKETKKLQRKLSDYQIIQANQNMSKKQYEPSVDFMCILHFFEDSHIIFINYHQQVSFILNKVFSKLK